MPYSSRMNTDRPDPSAIVTRAELAAGLRALREQSGVTYRELVERSGGLHGTVSGWFSGHHVPVKASSEMFDRVLAACGVDSRAERQRWWDAVGRVRSSPGRKHSRKGQAPYKGLEAFGEQDREWFFGRDDVTDTLVARVDALAETGGGVVVVLGASGSGKSSLLRAGLAGAREGVTVRSGFAGARDFVDTETHTAVLVFDQIEELWTLATDDERAAFRDAVRRVLDGSSVVVVFGLRADFYQNAIGEDVFVRGLGDSPVVVGRLGPTEVADVIVEPARKAGMTVDDALLRALTKEFEPRGSTFAHDQGALPMLSHALLSTWQLAKGNKLTVDDYHATGGLAGAVQQSAETVFESLTPAQQEQARRIFVRLVNIDGEVLTRRRVARAELFHGDGVDADVETVLEAFTASRLLTVEEEAVSVTHEVLLTAWDRMRLWIADDRQWLLTHRRLTDAAVLWDEAGRDTGSVLSRSRLDAVEDSLADGDHRDDLNAVERDFLAASRDRVDHFRSQRRRRRRVLEGLAAALAVVTVVAVGSAGVAFSARADADQRRADAESALAGQLSLQAERLRDVDPALAVQMALAAYELSPTVSARSALLDASAIAAPVRFSGFEGDTMARTDESGRFLMTARADGRVEVRSLADDGMPVVGSIDTGVLGGARVIATSPANHLVAVGGASGTSVWSIENPSEPVELARLQTGDTGMLSFDPSGLVLATGQYRSDVTLWNVGDLRRPSQLALLTNPGGVSSVAFSPDGRTIVTGGTSRSLRVWRLDDPKSPVFETPTDSSTYEYRQLAFGPEGETLVAGTTGREVARWSVDRAGTLRDLPPLTGFDDFVTDVAFSADGEHVAAVASDSTVRLWSADSGELIDALPGGAQLTSLAFGMDDRVLATAGKDGVLRLWSLPGPVLGGHGDAVYIIPLDAGGKKMVAGAGVRGQGLRVWDVTDPDDAQVGPIPLVGVAGERVDGAAAITRDGRVVAGGLVSGGFQLWNVDDVDSPVLLSGPHAAVRTLVGSLAFDGDGDLLAVSPQDSTDIALWDVSEPAAPRQVSTFDAGSNPVVIGFSPDGSTLAIPTVGDTVELWNVADPANPRLRTELGGFENDANVAVFSPDGTILAAGSADNTIRLWDVTAPDEPKQLTRITGLRAAVFSINFNPDGTRIVAGVDGNSMSIWNIEDSRNPVIDATLTAYGDRVNDAAFGTNGDVVFGGGPAGNVRVWRTEPEAVKARICESGGLGITESEWARYAPGIPYRALC